LLSSAGASVFAGSDAKIQKKHAIYGILIKYISAFYKLYVYHNDSGLSFAELLICTPSSLFFIKSLLAITLININKDSCTYWKTCQLSNGLYEQTISYLVSQPPGLLVFLSPH